MKEFNIYYSFKDDKNNNNNKNSEDFEYADITENSIKITAYNGDLNCIDIPEKIDNKTVVAIAGSFKCKNAEFICIPSTVERIERGAFQSSKLKGIVWEEENGIFYVIEDAAFMNCSELEEVILPEKTLYIGKSAFAMCKKLKDFSMPPYIQSIGRGAFTHCESLENIKFKYTASIGKEAFSGCKRLKKLDMSDCASWNITIGKSAFSGCTLLRKVKLPCFLKSIGDNAFNSCTSLEKIYIPKYVEHIGKFAFLKCKSLSHIDVDRNNKKYYSHNGILYNGNCTELICCPCNYGYPYYYNILHLPAELEIIHDKAFSFAKNIKTINIPKSVKQIGKQAFENSPRLERIVVSPENKYFSGNGVLFNKDRTSLICYPKGKRSEEYTIPKSVKRIEDHAFDQKTAVSSLDPTAGQNEYLAKITIPESVEYIGLNHFRSFKYGKQEEIIIFCKKDSYAHKYFSHYHNCIAK